MSRPAGAAQVISRPEVIPSHLLKAAVADKITPIVTIVTCPQKEKAKVRPKRAKREKRAKEKAKLKTKTITAAITAPATTVSYKLLRSG